MVTVGIYWKVKNFDFVNFDDELYVTENIQVQRGLSWQGIVWAFTTFHASNWHPMTWMSHMLDCHLFGENPGWHHLTNLFFHLVNTILLFIVFRKMTGQVWESGLVAALFALHPLHVESVAWISERKDVLSTFFWILTMWRYAHWVKYGGSARYLVVLLCFALGLMVKPMLVTLPFVLLLMDCWPLNRLKWRNSIETFDSSKTPTLETVPQKATFSRLIWEKTPLIFLSGISSVITFVAQQGGGAVLAFSSLPLKARLANALVSYVSYIAKMLWPQDLAVFYPHPVAISVWKIVGAGIFLILATVLALWKIRQHPYLITGWLWYLGTLVPVIGIVQVGGQSMADRYTYVPLIGLFVMVSWGIPEVLKKFPHRNVVLWVASMAILAACIIMTSRQVGYWQNSNTLFEHALKVTKNNWKVHNNLGLTLANQGRTTEGIGHYLQALRINPDYFKAHHNLGNAFFLKGNTDGAIEHYLEALRLKPDLLEAHVNVGGALYKQGRTGEAIEHYLQALRIKPDHVEVHINLAIALFRKGDIEGAIVHLQKVLRINPEHIRAKNMLKDILTIQQ
jgi:tetratricopeptide (TPR) repeat protein